MNRSPNETHPEDRRNLIIFLALCMLAYLGYDHFIHQPSLLKAQQAAARQKQAIQTAIAQDPNGGRTLSRAEALASSGRIAITNPDLAGSINLKGGRIDDLSLTQYFTTPGGNEPVVLLAPARTQYPQYAEFNWLGSNVKLPDAATVWAVKQGSAAALSKDAPVTLTWNNGQGLAFERTYALDDQYMFTITQRVTNSGRTPVTLNPFASVTRHGMPDGENASIMHEGPIGLVDGVLEEQSYSTIEKNPNQIFQGKSGWTGITEKYWFAGIIPDKTQDNTFRFLSQPLPLIKTYAYQADVTGSPMVVAPGASVENQMQFFAGPKKMAVLKDYEQKYSIDKFDLVIDFGMFWFLTKPFSLILTWLGHTIGSFAVAILVFTVMIRLCVFPLASKSYRSFARLRRINPQMMELREKYVEDRQQLQKAIFELYQREKVNPMAGCLPILIQIPIFFALYKVLYVSLEMRHAPFWGWINDMSTVDPTSVFNLFGLIPWTPPTFLMIGAWPLIMGITLFLQQKLNPPPTDAVQAKVLGFMPVLMTFLLAHFPAGLVIYWSWSNTLSILQQYVLMRQEGVKVHLFAKDEIEPQPPAKA